MGKGIDVTLANGYIVSIDVGTEGSYVGLVNPNGYIISDKRLTDEEKKSLVEVVSE